MALNDQAAQGQMNEQDNENSDPTNACSRCSKSMCNFCRVLCSTSKSIDYSPCCMATVFGIMAVLTLSISLSMNILNEYAETEVIKTASDIRDLADNQPYILTLDLKKLGNKKFETLIILYGMRNLQQVKFFHFLDYTVLAEIASDNDIITSDNYAINSTFSDKVTSCKYKSSTSNDEHDCSCASDSIKFPFASQLNDKEYSTDFSLKYRLIDWVQIYPFQVLLKQLCAIPKADSTVSKDFDMLEITFSKSWSGWQKNLTATKNVNEFFLRAVYPSKFGGHTDFLEILGFSLAGVCAFIGVCILIAHHCCKRGQK